MLAEIVKIRITILVSLTTALGYILGAEKFDVNFIFPVIGIFLLACGSAAMNQYQECKTDILMDRTKNRPIPSKRIDKKSVLAISLFLLASGSAVLYFKVNILSLVIGLLTFYWYNGVYTVLKKKIALAIIPGSIVGALPPLAGWAAANGNIMDLRILFIALYFFIWQIPHFWLLLLIYGKDYEKAGYPVLTQIFDNKTLVKVTFIWIIITAAVAACMPFLNIIYYPVISVLLFVLSAILIITGVGFLRSDAGKKQVLKMFISINVFTLFLILLLSADKLIYLALN